SRVTAVCLPVFSLPCCHGSGNLSVRYYVGAQDVIQCVMEDVVPQAFLDLRWRHVPCQGRPHPICLQNCVRSTPRRLPMWWPPTPPTPSVWGSTIRGARTGTRTPRSVVCTQNWERLQGMR